MGGHAKKFKSQAFKGDRYGSKYGNKWSGGSTWNKRQDNSIKYNKKTTLDGGVKDKKLDVKKDPKVDSKKDPKTES